MLVLSRKQGESIAIESDIEIEVLSIRKGRVRLGIRAPRTRKIVRAEVIEISDMNGDAPVAENTLDAAPRRHRRVPAVVINAKSTCH